MLGARLILSRRTVKKAGSPGLPRAANHRQALGFRRRHARGRPAGKRRQAAEPIRRDVFSDLRSSPAQRSGACPVQRRRPASAGQPLLVLAMRLQAGEIKPTAESTKARIASGQKSAPPGSGRSPVCRGKQADTTRRNSSGVDQAWREIHPGLPWHSSRRSCGSALCCCRIAQAGCQSGQELCLRFDCRARREAT